LDSALHNQHSTSYKDIQPDDSLRVGRLSNDVSKVNMTEDLERGTFLLNDKKKIKDKRLLNKLIDKTTMSQKKIRPKSSKGFRTSQVKVGTMNNFDIKNAKNVKNVIYERKVTNYLSSNLQGNRIKSRQSGRKKTNISTPKDSNIDKLGFGKHLWDIGSKLDCNKLLVSNSVLGGNKSVKSGKSRNVPNNLTNVKTQNPHFDNFSFVRPQSTKEGAASGNRKQKIKKTKNAKNKITDNSINAISSMMSNKSAYYKSRDDFQKLVKARPGQISKNNGSGTHKLDQSKSFVQDPSKGNVNNRKLMNANFKEVKKLLHKNVDIDIFKHLIKPYKK
jgi:hypothetical protein